jgi:hypothetical protein
MAQQYAPHDQAAFRLFGRTATTTTTWYIDQTAPAGSDRRRSSPCAADAGAVTTTSSRADSNPRRSGRRRRTGWQGRSSRPSGRSTTTSTSRAGRRHAPDVRLPVGRTRSRAMNSSLIGQVGGEFQARADQLANLASSGAASMAGATDAAVASGNQAIANAGVAPPVTVGGPVGAPGIAGSTRAGSSSTTAALSGSRRSKRGGYAKAGWPDRSSAEPPRYAGGAGRVHVGDGAGQLSEGECDQDPRPGRPDVAMNTSAAPGQPAAGHRLPEPDRCRVPAGHDEGVRAEGQAAGRQNTQWQQEFTEKQRQFNKSLTETIGATTFR